MPVKVSADHIYKIFGPSPEDAIERIDRGETKDAILEETGNVVGVADASFDVEQGQVFMVMGLSGSGKSTLIRCINRLIAPTSGRMYVDGEDITSFDDHQLRELRRTKMAMVFQHFALFPHKTVAENVEYGLKVRGVSSQERRDKALGTLELVGLQGWESYYPDSLSGGMQQRVGLARALANDPEILLMDEAFSALDPLIRREMQDELIQLQRAVHKTIIFITHDLSEALKLGDRVAVMKDGLIIQIGTPEEIVSAPADEYVAAFTQDVDRGRVFSVTSIMRAPETLLQGHDVVRTAMFRMRESRHDLLFIVDGQHHPVGVVLAEDVARAVREGINDLGKVMQTDFSTTEESSTLADVYQLCSSGVPVAVVDDRSRLVGEVHALDLLANLTPDSLTQEPEPEESGTTTAVPGQEDPSQDPSQSVG
jgi:glycine betaine/proline transport system ATP-binding protein